MEEYAGMWEDIIDGAIITDDHNHFETEEFIKYLKPDIFFSGIKDKFQDSALRHSFKAAPFIRLCRPLRRIQRRLEFCQ